MINVKRYIVSTAHGAPAALELGEACVCEACLQAKAAA
jgi:hypothetical protein